MQFLAALICRRVALRDFWYMHIHTYTYLNLNICKNLNVDNLDYSQIQIIQTEDSEILHNHTSQVSNTIINNMSPNSAKTESRLLKSSSNVTIAISHTMNILRQCINNPYITLSQLYGNTKSYWLTKALHCRESMRIYYAILPLDVFYGTQIDIEKTHLQQSNMFDSIVPLHAQNKGLIPLNCEYRYFLQNQTKTHFIFQIFCVSQKILQQYANKYLGKVLCLNPMELFCGLYDLYPNLTQYTIIFQDDNKHALCHYVNGLLSVSILLERNEALQNHYGLIEDFNTIFYCDFSGKPDLLCDFTNITTLFDAPLSECLHILALHRIRTKPSCTNFYPQSFYKMRSYVKALFACVLVIFIFCFGVFYSNKYQYNKFLQQERQKYHTQIEALYQKKQHYPLMYERIYRQLLENHSFNFCLQQDYYQKSKEYMWIQSNCAKSIKQN